MRLFLILAFMFPMSAFAAKKMLIMDFRNLDQDPNFQYLEGSITDAVKKLLREKFEFFEPEANDVEKRAQDSYFLFPEDYHNKNVALQLGLMTDQDIVISGGFQKRYSARGEAFILVDVMIFDIENKKLVRQFKNEIKVNAAIFESIDKLAQKVAQEAQEILPHKGQFEFDRYAPITQTQVTLLGGYNLNSFSSPMHKETVLTSGSSMSAADYGGMWIAAELRRDRFLDRNRLVGFFRADFQMINSQFAISGTADRSSATGMGGAASVGLGYQLLRYKRVFVLGLLQGGFFYERVKMDFSNFKSAPLDIGTGSPITTITGDIFGPQAGAGLRLGWQINAYFSLELGAVYQQSFVQGNSSGNVITAAGFGLRI